MLRIVKRLDGPANPAATLTLPYEARQRSRLRTRLDDGREVALLLARGPALRGGDLLRIEEGQVVEVRAEPERVSTARARDPLLLARACYHLGNRHVPLQIGELWVRYLADHVLDAMVEQLDLEVARETAPFDPEGGAYEHAHGHARHAHP